MKESKIVIRVDGGICSQIATVSMGLRLAEKFAGEAEVKYDLSWYRNYGTDMNGRFVRNWDFPKAFPEIVCVEATDDEIASLSRRHPSRGLNIEAFRPPVYIAGYPDRYPNMCAQAQRLKKAFRPEIDSLTDRWLTALAERKTCAVHVRRGDLATFNPAYGNPASLDYFRKAVAIVRGLEPGVRFLFFSDEPDWVLGTLLPALPHDIDAELLEGHGSESGYLDLYLMSRCDYIISSSGSFGAFAAVLSDTCKALVMCRNRTYAFKYLKNVIYVNDSYREEGLPSASKPLVRGWIGRLLGSIRRKS